MNLKERILSAVGKVAAKDLAEECSNGNGSGLGEFAKSGVVFEVGDYEFKAMMAANIQRQMVMRGGRPSALSFNPAK
jgi:hypothetical protein